MRDPLASLRLMKTVERPAQLFVRGQGSWLWDSEGRAYLDFTQGWAVNSLGHSPSVVVDALKRQAESLINPGPAYYNRGMLKLASRLCQASGSDQAYFLNSGAEANEGAIKLARKWGQLHRGGAFRIVTACNSFHGRTLATMSASGKPAFETLFEPKVPGFTKVPYDDLDALVARHALAEGLLINAPQPDCLCFTPALTVSRANVDEMLRRLNRAFALANSKPLESA